MESLGGNSCKWNCDRLVANGGWRLELEGLRFLSRDYSLVHTYVDPFSTSYLIIPYAYCLSSHNPGGGCGKLNFPDWGSNIIYLVI